MLFTANLYHPPPAYIYLWHPCWCLSQSKPLSSTIPPNTCNCGTPVWLVRRAALFLCRVDWEHYWAAAPQQRQIVGKWGSAGSLMSETVSKRPPAVICLRGATIIRLSLTSFAPAPSLRNTFVKILWFLLPLPKISNHHQIALEY